MCRVVEEPMPSRRAARQAAARAQQAAQRRRAEESKAEEADKRRGRRLRSEFSTRHLHARHSTTQSISFIIQSA